MSHELPHDLIAAAHAAQALDAAREVWAAELPAATRDAIAMVTALNGQMPREYGDMLAAWLSNSGHPQPRTYVLADELLRLAGRLAATQYLAERLPAADFPELRLTRVETLQEANVNSALALVTHYVRGNIAPVRLAFGQSLAPATDPRDAMTFVTALTAAAGACARAGARATGVEATALLAREGVRAAR